MSPKGASPAGRPVPGSVEKEADRLHTAAIRLLRTLRKQDDAGGMSAPRLSALSVVVFSGPLTLGGLANAEQVRPPTMTKIVTALERSGHVRRRSDKRDARLTLIVATAKGKRTLAAGRRRRVAALASAIRSLDQQSSGQTATLVKVLEEIVAAMRAKPWSEHPPPLGSRRRRTTP
ncbi:MAG TPA: MarR family transcriptional regulator [Gemmatimonadaceae bacterium]|nr:MarR family transcriptional regulator [Gemmatimonadaceae bacterium]